MFLVRVCITQNTFVLMDLNVGGRISMFHVLIMNYHGDTFVQKHVLENHFLD